MGVLEEAIREHLELKRRHGASEEEVERKELEALGPARREFEGADEEASEDEVPEDEVPEDEPEVAEPPPEEQAEPVAEPVPEPPPPPEPPIAEPATTRLHESPAVEPRLPEGDAPDFAADEEEAAERSPPRDFDFD